MKPLTCYIIDDEYRAISLLSKFISNTPGLELAGSSEDPSEAVRIVSTLRPQLTFLDINMPQISGTDVFGMIAPFTMPVFTTAYDNFAATAFDLQATDFLLKPFSYDRFLQAVNRVKEMVSPPSDRDFFFVKCESKGKKIRIDFSSITFLQGAQNYVNIHLDDGSKHMTYFTMKEMEEELPANRFSRIHKSYIVNIDKIRSIETGAIVLTEGTLLLVGEVYREAFHQKLAAFTIVSKRQL